MYDGYIMKKDYNKEALSLHKKHKGKLEIRSTVPLGTTDDLSRAYTPGVAAVCKKIAEDKQAAKEYTTKGNTVAIVSDGSAILGLGNLGPEAALPVMEGKAILFKEFGGVDAFPIVLDTQDTEEIIRIVKAIAPTFGGINLEDISAPRCFEIERRLRKELSIPVFHDDQHGTAVVTLAGLINALALRGIKKSEARVVINGAGAAGTAIAELLTAYGFEWIVMLDSKGVLTVDRDDLNPEKRTLAAKTNPENISGSLADAIQDTDVFIGVSAPDVLTAKMVKTMNVSPIIFALANPTPEIMPDEAKKGGAYIVATGRSDFPNQVNNVLAFPGIFKGLLANNISQITDEMLVAAAEALASHVAKPSPQAILPNPLDKTISQAIVQAFEPFGSHEA
jgi:malate dehydrogenase (oxaloacetate-decarboxylating)